MFPWHTEPKVPLHHFCFSSSQEFYIPFLRFVPWEFPEKREISKKLGISGNLRKTLPDEKSVWQKGKYREGFINSHRSDKILAKKVRKVHFEYPPQIGMFLRFCQISWQHRFCLSLTAILSASSLCPFPLLISVNIPTNLEGFFRWF